MSAGKKPPDPPWSAPTLSDLLRSHLGDKNQESPLLLPGQEAGSTLATEMEISLDQSTRPQLTCLPHRTQPPCMVPLP